MALSKQAKDRLVVGIMPLVDKIARSLARQVGDFADPDELTGVGLAAVMEQVDRYDPSLGYSFATVARPRIEGAMIDFLREQGKQRMVPRGVLKAGKEIATAREALQRVLGRTPSREEMARELKITPEDYDRKLTRSEIYTTVSLDAPLTGAEGDDEGTLEGVIASPVLSPEERMREVEDKWNMIELISALTQEQRDVADLKARGLSNVRVGLILHLSPARVGAIIQESQEAIRQAKTALIRAAEPVRAGQDLQSLPAPTTIRGLLTNPRGRPVQIGRLIHVGSLGERIHMANPETGRALCAPHNFDVRPADGTQVTCYRCQKLMAVNRALRGSDIAVGTAKPIVTAATARRGKR